MNDWSNEFPTKPGFYFFRECIRGEGKESILKIETPTDTFTFAHVIGVRCLMLKQDFRNYEFLGPFTVSDVEQTPYCWHCGTVLAYAPKLRCENCPEECDVEGCEEIGCQV